MDIHGHGAAIKRRQSLSPASQPHASIPVSTESRPLTASVCANTFLAHNLDHITTTASGEIRMFEANGAGVGVGDLDNDGDLDLVLGNYDWP